MGSEMCIRDRQSIAAFGGVAGGLLMSTWGGPKRKVKGVLLGMSCLLYTSDAADERSSVDLGGRRIIKKKTHQHNIGETVVVNKKMDNQDRRKHKE